MESAAPPPPILRAEDFLVSENHSSINHMCILILPRVLINNRFCHLTCATCSPILKYLFHKSPFTGSCNPYVERAIPFCLWLQHRLWKWLGTYEEHTGCKPDNRSPPLSGTFAKLRKANISSSFLCVCLSVRPPRIDPAPIGWIFVKFNVYFFFFRKYVNEIEGPLKCNKNNGYFTRRPMYSYDISLNFS